MDTSEHLKQILNMTANFYMQLHQAHWNITGKEFYQLHDMFGDIYEEVFTALDPIAENIRKLDKMVCFCPSEVDNSQLIDLQVTGSIDQMLPTLINNNQMVISALKQGIAAAKIEAHYDIENFLAERIDQHNKHAWMLKSLEG